MIFEVRVSGTELEDTFRALLAVAAQPRKDFSKMVKETKKKSQGGEIEQLEIEIDSNEIEGRVLKARGKF